MECKPSLERLLTTKLTATQGYLLAKFIKKVDGIYTPYQEGMKKLDEKYITIRDREGGKEGEKERVILDVAAYKKEEAELLDVEEELDVPMVDKNTIPETQQEGLALLPIDYLKLDWMITDEEDK